MNVGKQPRWRLQHCLFFLSLSCCGVCTWSCICAGVSHSDGAFFLLCCVSVCGPVYALMYPIVIERSSCCVVCLYVVPSMRWCIPYWWIVLPVVLGVCMWSRLCSGVSHSDGAFFLLCCVCLYVVLSMCYSIP
jgi:hypothetical protein